MTAAKSDVRPGRLGRYQRAWLRWDLLAGLTTAVTTAKTA
jgi:hypothetical protein